MHFLLPQTASLSDLVLWGGALRGTPFTGGAVLTLEKG